MDGHLLEFPPKGPKGDLGIAQRVAKSSSWGSLMASLPGGSSPRPRALSSAVLTHDDGPSARCPLPSLLGVIPCQHTAHMSRMHALPRSEAAHELVGSHVLRQP